MDKYTKCEVCGELIDREAYLSIQAVCSDRCALQAANSEWCKDETLAEELKRISLEPWNNQGDYVVWAYSGEHEDGTPYTVIEEREPIDQAKCIMAYQNGERLPEVR